jgi:hypothetical protein
LTSLRTSDPHAPDLVEGIDALRTFVTVFRSRIPGARFVPLGTTEHVHHTERLRWKIMHGDGTMLSTGVFVGITDGELLCHIVGFLDP